MSYVQRILQPGETVRHTAQIHWIVYWPGALLLLLALLTLIYGEFISNQRMLIWQVIAAVFAACGLFFLVREWFTWWGTEIAVTNLRVVYKTGVVSRQTNEMNMDKVESVQVDQSIVGRLLDYGAVRIVGTGEGVEKLLNVASPIELRNSITGV